MTHTTPNTLLSNFKINWKLGKRFYMIIFFAKKINE